MCENDFAKLYFSSEFSVLERCSLPPNRWPCKFGTLGFFSFEKFFFRETSGDGLLKFRDWVIAMPKNFLRLGNGFGTLFFEHIVYILRTMRYITYNSLLLCETLPTLSPRPPGSWIPIPMWKLGDSLSIPTWNGNVFWPGGNLPVLTSSPAMCSK